MLNRRVLLTAAAASGVTALLPACASTGSPAGATPAAFAGVTGKAARLNALYETTFNRILDDSPELGTSLGLDNGARAGLKARLTPQTVEQERRQLTRNRDLLAGMREIGRDGLTGLDAVNYDTLEYVSAQTVSGGERFNYGTRGYPTPYVLSQLTGSYQSTPDFLDSQHSIETREDAEAYLSRLEAFGRNLGQEAERAREDGARGVIPPDFVIDKALGQMRTLRDTPTADTTLVASLVRRTREKNLEGDWSARAGRIVEGPIRTALASQIALLEGWRSNAVHTAGVQRLPDGAAYYQFGAEVSTTTSYTGDDIHRIGLEQVAEISGRIDGILRAQGMTQGTVGQRVASISERPGQVYPNTDAGKTQLLADLNGQIRALAPRLPELFGTLPRAPVEVRRVPPAIEAGAPGGYYQSPTLDGSRPGAYYINLRDTAEWPRFTLPTLTYHEANPGHHLQSVLALEAEGLPMLRRIVWFSGYGEGWALYSEQLADEIGMYRDDPFGEVGYLQSLLFRATRLVVDSGLHSKGWSREQAIRYMVDTLGDQETSVTTEVERYCVWPGQASSYKIGHTKWVELRDRARTRLGARFDIRAFHDNALLAGPMPLAVLERRVDEWVSAQAA